MLISVVCRLRGQDAQQIIDAAAKVYAGAASYAAEVDSRSINLMFAQSPGKAGAAPDYRASGTDYRRLQLKMRRPYDYLLGMQSFRDYSAGPAERPAPWAIIARTDRTLPKQGMWLGGKFLISDVPAEQFTALANSRLAYRGMEDVVLRNFKAQGAEPAEGPLTFGLQEAEVIGRETLERPAYRIVARTAEGYPIMLWIEKDSFLIVRTIVQRPRLAGGAVGVQTGNPAFVVVTETFYRNQQLNPKFGSAEFTISEPASTDRLSAEQMGFGPVADLVKLADVKPLPDAGKGGVPDENPAEGAEAGKPAQSANAQGQMLTYEQMSGIVLIEGDGGGTATGFMTKIRDVDFVVTNLHVLVGNKKLTLKTLRGEELEPQGIFGAVGSDIAILRVAKGAGDLRMAADVLQSSKIGDRVVVVGNRRGGGVATQTTGSIKGVGPRLIEVDANFQPGNSGSPIVNLGTNEVIGVATYSETRRIDVDEGAAHLFNAANSTEAAGVEKRWFGYRLDSVSKWEAVDLAKWKQQGDRLGKFRETSEALLAFIRFDFKTARQHPRLTAILDGFESRYKNAGGNGVTAASEIKDLFRVIRTISDDGMRDLATGDYYDYFRTCQYWENNVNAQMEFRRQIVEVLKKYEANSSLYSSRMHGGG